MGALGLSETQSSPLDDFELLRQIKAGRRAFKARKKAGRKARRKAKLKLVTSVCWKKLQFYLQRPWEGFRKATTKPRPNHDQTSNMTGQGLESMGGREKLEKLSLSQAKVKKIGFISVWNVDEQ